MPSISPLLGHPPLDAATASTSSPTATDLSRDGCRHRRGTANASLSRATSTTPARHGQSIHPRSSAPPGAASGSTSSSTPSAPARWRTTTSSACARPAPTSRSSTRRRGTRSEELNYRTHRKILVVDGEVGFTGGAGIADHWLGNAQTTRTTGATRRSQVRGPIVAAAGSGVLRELRRGRRPGGARARSRSARRPDDDGASMLIRSSPTGGSNDLKRLYLLALAPARTSVDMTTPYFVTDESTDVGAGGRGAPRRQDPDSRRRRHHRRDAGQVRVAPCLRTADAAASSSSNINRR